MLEIVARNGQSEKAEFFLPDEVAEVTYSAFLDFVKAEEKYHNANSTDEGDPAEAISRILDAVRTFVDGPVESLPFEGESKDDLSLVWLYRYFAGLIKDYVPRSGESSEAYEDRVLKRGGFDTAFSCRYAGETYYIEPDRVKRYLGAQKSYTVGEVVEISEVDRLLSREAEKTGDPDGSLTFERDLTAMAVLLRKEGEALPVNTPERIAFLRSRAEHFQNLPMHIVLGVRFFLASMCGVYGLSLATLPSFMASLERNSPATLRRLRRKAKQERVKQGYLNTLIKKSVVSGFIRRLRKTAGSIVLALHRGSLPFRLIMPMLPTCFLST